MTGNRIFGITNAIKPEALLASEGPFRFAYSSKPLTSYHFPTLPLYSPTPLQSRLALDLGYHISSNRVSPASAYTATPKG